MSTPPVFAGFSAFAVFALRLACDPFSSYIAENRIMRIAFFIVSLLFFLAWMILSVIRSDLWIAVLTAVMVLISAAQLYLAFRERRRGSRKP